MRWFVEISALGVKPGSTTTLCVEAPQWQPALQKARALRGDEGPLGNFSIELLEDGFRAIDPVSRLRYLVKRAPENAALTTTLPADSPTPSTKPEAAEAAKAKEQEKAKEPPAAAKEEAPEPEIPPPPAQRALAQTMVFASQGAASVSDSPAHEPVVEAAPAPVAEAPAAEPPPRTSAKTIAFSSTGSAAVIEAAAAIELARRQAPTIPEPVPAAGATTPALPGYTLVNEREDNPSERSPLSYREHVYAVAPGTPDEDAERLILDRFESVRQSLEQARAGKLINLAIFDHVFQGRPQRRPLVTLTWKDWKNEAPELNFPARDGVSVPPPANVATPSLVPPVSTTPASKPASVAKERSAPPEAMTPAPPTKPLATKSSASSAPSAPPRSSQPVPSSTKIPAAPRAASFSKTPPSRPTPAPQKPQKRLSGEDLLTELFEAFADLHFLRDSIEGAEFVLALALEKLPSEVGLVSLFDINKREFVIVRQTGGKRAVGQRQPERAELAISAMRKRHAIVLSTPAEAAGADDDRFRAIGVTVRSLVCAPVELGGRYLGLIELLNPLDGSVFNEGDGNALTYIGQQFAEFAASRGVMIDPEQLKEAPKSTPASAKRR